MQSYTIQFERLPAAGTDRRPPRQPAFCVAGPYELMNRLQQFLPLQLSSVHQLLLLEFKPLPQFSVEVGVHTLFLVTAINTEFGSSVLC